MSCKHEKTEGREGRKYCLDCGADLGLNTLGSGWGKNVGPVTLPIDMALQRRVRCHCLGAFGQRCFACDPDGTMYGPVRPELAVRIDG